MTTKHEQWALASPQEHRWQLGPVGERGEETITILRGGVYGILSVPASATNGDRGPFERACACVNACAGIADPGAAIAELRDALRLALDAVTAANERALTNNRMAVIADTTLAAAKIGQALALVEVGK